MPKETKNVAARVETLVRPVIEELGLQIWDVRFEKEGAEWFLRVFVERASQQDEPMDTDTCVLVSRAIDPILDEADPISQSYYLEVGSPGMGRKLVRDEHYAQCTGQKVQLHFFQKNENGEKELEGILKGKQNGIVTIELPSGVKEFSEKEISYSKLCDDEELFL